MRYRDAAAAFVPHSAQEARVQREMLGWIDRFPADILTRENEQAHLTSSAMICDGTAAQVLMAWHSIYRSWAWTGGHADGEDDPIGVARREAEEETGITGLQLLSPEPIGLDILPVKGHCRRGVWVKEHLHLSVCYAFAADPALPLRSRPDENKAVGWLPADRLPDYVAEAAMLPVYQRLVERLQPLCAGAL